MNNIIVPDANLFIKFIYPEGDSSQAKQFFKDCYEMDCVLIAPELLKYEVIKATTFFKCDVEKVLDLLDVYEETYLNFKSPSRSEWKKATEITNDGHPKSGFPSMYDSIYHALAIENNGVFVTADRRHFEKSKHFGYISLLSEWGNFQHIHKR